MTGVARHDHPVGSDGATGERAVDQPGLRQGGRGPGVPETQRRPGRLVARRAVRVEVGPRPKLERGGGIVGRGEAGQGREVGQRGDIEVTGLCHRGEQGRGRTRRRRAPVELAGREGQRVTGRRGVAGEAFSATREAPGLGARHAVFHHGEGLIRAILGDEGGFGLRVVPAVGQAVGAGRGLDEKPRFDPPRRGGIAAGQVEVEVFHPDRPGRKGPVSRGGKAVAAGGVGQRKPAPLARMIRPERHDGLVRHQARGRGQGGDGAECTRRREGRRERRAPGGRGRHEAADRAVVQIDDQHVAVRRIDSEGTDPGERRELLHAVSSDRLRAVGTQRPDASAREIGKEVVAIQGREARAARDDAAGDRLAGGARVVPDRSDERRGRRWIGPRAGDVALAVVPAVVAAAHDDVDFLARPLADIGAPEQAARRVEGDAPRVAQSGCPELGAHGGRVDRGAVERGGADKGIVRGHGVSAGVHRRVGRGRKRARPLVDVEAHDAREEVAVDALAVLERVVGGPFITE